MESSDRWARRLYQKYVTAAGYTDRCGSCGRSGRLRIRLAWFAPDQVQHCGVSVRLCDCGCQVVSALARGEVASEIVRRFLGDLGQADYVEIRSPEPVRAH